MLTLNNSGEILAGKTYYKTKCHYPRVHDFLDIVVGSWDGGTSKWTVTVGSTDSSQQLSAAELLALINFCGYLNEE